MSNLNILQINKLAEFRIRAHMRSFLKDPIQIDRGLLDKAIIRLNQLPFQHSDPTQNIVIDLLVESYRRGFIEDEDLTVDGYKLVKPAIFRRHSQIERTSHTHAMNERLTGIG